MDRLPVDKTTHFDVNNVDEAIMVINTLIKRDLNDDRITDNMMGLEEFIDGDWSEYQNEEGMDINELIEEEL